MRIEDITMPTLERTPAYTLPGSNRAFGKKPSGVTDDIVRVMLVEDVASDATLTRIALESTRIPFRMTTARRGDEALTMIELQHLCNPAEIPDLILLDLGLPGMDGFEILAELAEMSPVVRGIPIVILTAHEHFEYIRKTYPLCIMSYIQKPCKAQDMYAILTCIYRGKRNMGELHIAL